MRMQPLPVLGFAIPLLLLAVVPSPATVLPSSPAAASVYSPQALSPSTLSVPTSPDSFVSPPTLPSEPSTFVSPATLPSVQPGSLGVSDGYDSFSSPGSSISPVSLSPISPGSYQVSPATITPLSPSSPVSLLYTGSPDAPYSPAGTPMVLNVPTPTETPSSLFSSAPPPTPSVTNQFNNSPVSFGPAFAVPEPRLTSVVVFAMAIALGIAFVRRRKKLALASLQG
jgi:hypothetical protein